MLLFKHKRLNFNSKAQKLELENFLIGFDGIELSVLDNGDYELNLKDISGFGNGAFIFKKDDLITNQLNRKTNDTWEDENGRLYLNVLNNWVHSSLAY